MVYVDTSVLVTLLANEPAAATVLDWLRRQPAGSLYISAWTITEFSSALSLKVRTRQIDGGQRDLALAAFNRLVSESLSVIPVTTTHFHAAARFCDRVDLGLRAADGLHAAIAFESGLPMATLDIKLAAACAGLGVSCEPLQ